jgi:Cu(I)/Ag(I) efflux system membrane protein CusA/SilA
MLQTGMQLMGIKVKGPDLKNYRSFGFRVTVFCKTIQGNKEQAVFADRIVGKPISESTDITRAASTIRNFDYGCSEVLPLLLNAAHSPEGRERYGVRVRLSKSVTWQSRRP